MEIKQMNSLSENKTEKFKKALPLEYFCVANSSGSHLYCIQIINGSIIAVCAKCLKIVSLTPP